MPIKIVASKVVEEYGKVPYVLVNITTGNDAYTSDDPDGVSLWIRKTTGGYGKHFVQNKSGTIAALNIRPATKWEMAYLLVSFTPGTLTILSDFNKQVAALCKAERKSVNDREIYVERIEGRSVFAVTYVEQSDSVYKQVRVPVGLKIGVSESASLKLLGHKIP